MEKNGMKEEQGLQNEELSPASTQGAGTVQDDQRLGAGQHHGEEGSYGIESEKAQTGNARRNAEEVDGTP